MMKRLTTLLMMLASATFAQQQKPLPLYPDGIPNSKPAPAGYVEKNVKEWITLVTQPVLIPYLPEKGKANGTAIIIFPGGGYAGLAIDHEGYAIARRFNEAGITAFVVKYRLPGDEIMPDKTIGPLQDAQRAIQMVREDAAKWGINSNKIGIIGFSAGGHLASTLGTHFEKAVIANPNNVSLRPDFEVLMYPVISFGPMAHVGSRENLIGMHPSQELIDLYSNEKQVTSATPPTFIVHAEDDNVVPVQNALLFYEALLANKVKAEMHLYPEGGHGFGLYNKTTSDLWFDRCLNWLKAGKMID
jgi:acetyl esterase/lipase